MRIVETNGDAGSPSGQAEAAALAAKIAALPHGNVRSRGPLWRTLRVVLWFIALTLLLAAALRVFYHDGTHFLTWINAFTRYVYLPAYVALAWAVWMRQRLLALPALLVVACHLFWMAPDFVRDRRFESTVTSAGVAAGESQKVRIFFANVLATNHDFGPLWQEIAESNAEIVVLAECSRFSNESFRRSPLMASYIAANPRTKLQHFEIVIFSKLPIKSEKQNWVAGRVLQTADIEVGSQTLRVIGLHAPRPMNRPEYDYYGYWKRVVPLLSAAKSPVVIVGDFNATEHSLVYKKLQDAGLRSVHDAVGRGYATTWPNDERWLPPIRIDQAFVSPDVECLEIREGHGEGSDHRPLILDVRLEAVVRAANAP